MIAIQKTIFTLLSRKKHSCLHTVDQGLEILWGHIVCDSHSFADRCNRANCDLWKCPLAQEWQRLAAADSLPIAEPLGSGHQPSEAAAGRPVLLALRAVQKWSRSAQFSSCCLPAGLPLPLAEAKCKGSHLTQVQIDTEQSEYKDKLEEMETTG